MADDEVIDPDVDDPDSEYMNSTMNVTCTLDVLNVSTNRSVHVRVQQIGVDASIQTDVAVPDRPKYESK